MFSISFGKSSMSINEPSVWHSTEVVNDYSILLLTAKLVAHPADPCECTQAITSAGSASTPDLSRWVSALSDSTWTSTPIQNEILADLLNQNETENGSNGTAEHAIVPQ
jgi:hypothetical protein